jgi:hypothetical protein
MKRAFAAMAAFSCLVGAALAAEMQACDVTVDIVDADPKGTNLREAPGGRIVAVLPAPAADDWLEAHVVGQAGDWFLIDSARNVGDDEKTLFRGRGYVHKSLAGASGLQSGAKVWADHDIKTRELEPSPPRDQAPEILGCWGAFVKIRCGNTTGWARGLCLNQRTTCG